MGANGSMCVVGDDDQSIYSFKHAHPEGIRQWHAVDPTDHHAISECRRCPTTVVRIANALIAHNADRIAGRQMTERPANGSGEVVVRQIARTTEADAVASKIAALIQVGVAPSEIIVLAQRATFATPIFTRLLRRKAFRSNPGRCGDGTGNDSAQERFAFLELLLNNEDRVALRWLLGRGHPSWRANPMPD